MEAPDTSGTVPEPRAAPAGGPVRAAAPGSWTRESRPRLARKVRLQWNAPRNQALLLYPEGALALNQSAQAVLELCDGNRTLDGIVRELASTFDGSATQRTSGESVQLSTDPGTGDVVDGAPEPAPRSAGVTSSTGADVPSPAGPADPARPAVGVSQPEADGVSLAGPERRETLVERDVRAFLDQLAHRGWLIDEKGVEG